MYNEIITNLALAFIIYLHIKPKKMTEAETAEFVTLNSKVDALGTAVTSALAALATVKADLASLQASTSDADVLTALKAAEEKLDASTAAITTALTPAA
jgi:hypothetical protein